jgi:orotate phosphoribosyltransferase
MGDELAKKIFRTCSLKGEFVLRSGQVSGEYFDKYLFESEPELLEQVAARMSALVPKGTETLAGLEMGGIPVAAAVALRARVPMLFVRKKAKEYGTRKLAEGPDFAGKRVAVVEDVVTTGGAIIDGTAALRAGGAKVDTVLCVIDRESGGPEKLKEHGLTLLSVFKASELRGAAR